MSARFVFCVHNHQPVGNFDDVFARAYARAYDPFLAFLERHAFLKVVLHTSGPLWEWIDEHEPAYIDRLAALVARGQVEMMTGAFYEPILPVIPRNDALGQIALLTQFLRERLHAEPAGAWIAERVWEPSLPALLARAGVAYTTLDDTHFRRAGAIEPQLGPYYLTDDQGARVAVFPIDKELRYRIPFHTPREAMDYLLAQPDGSVSVLADDGEKFGVWPKTYRQVWERGWLDEFARLLEDERARVESAHFRDVLADTAAAGVVYLPAASYAEMMEWALPVSAQEAIHALHEEHGDTALTHGGQWRSFLMRYPESNRAHHRVHALHARAQGCAAALRELWRAECNCAYWHGVFGGLYLPHLRGAVQTHLIRAERALGGTDAPAARVEDVDADGAEECLLAAGDALAVCDARGAIVSYAPPGIDANLADVLARREEYYHRFVAGAQLRDADDDAVTIHGVYLTKELGLERLLHYDSAPRGWFVERDLASIDDLAAAVTEACARPAPCAPQGRPRAAATAASATAEWTFRLGTRTIRKGVSVAQSDGRVQAAWDIGAGESCAWLGIDVSLSLFAGANACRVLALDGTMDAGDASLGGSFGAVYGLEIDDHVRRCTTILGCAGAAALLLAPVETVSLSEDGFERVLQGVSVVPVWRLEGADRAEIQIDVAVHIWPRGD